jgi:hypothetical protein
MSETCIGSSVTLGRVINLELIEERMKSVIWLQAATVFWLDEGIIFLNFSLHIGLVMLGRQKYIQQSH